MPQVAECHRITGEDCFILKLHLDALRALIGCSTASLTMARPRLRSCSHRPSRPGARLSPAFQARSGGTHRIKSGLLKLLATNGSCHSRSVATWPRRSPPADVSLGHSLSECIVCVTAIWLGARSRLQGAYAC
jgi:hypothetical protein